VKHADLSIPWLTLENLKFQLNVVLLLFRGGLARKCGNVHHATDKVAERPGGSKIFGLLLNNPEKQTFHVAARRNRRNAMLAANFQPKSPVCSRGGESNH
jgi:hypothetical protein